MTNKSIILGLATLIIGGAILVPRALAYRGNLTTQGPRYSEERHEAMEKAFETNNYNAWKALVDGRSRVSDVINAGNFVEFAKAHKLAEEGKFEEANKIRESLGLTQGIGNRSGCMSGRQGRGGYIL